MRSHFRITGRCLFTLRAEQPTASLCALLQTWLEEDASSRRIHLVLTFVVMEGLLETQWTSTKPHQFTQGKVPLWKALYYCSERSLTCSVQGNSSPSSSFITEKGLFFRRRDHSLVCAPPRGSHREGLLERGGFQPGGAGRVHFGAVVWALGIPERRHI